ncbi:MAG: choice-of-anchor D domain-containing protein [Bacteroidota bacterium]|nr:choice-of-anchor D domain-containing protein [Bacteroidota bacterium]
MRPIGRIARSLPGIVAILLLACSARAQFPASCDKDKECVGHAVTISVSHGKGAQYVDVDTSYRIYGMDTALTFEAWIAPEQQPGKIQYIAGLWGPNKDNNDQWVFYIQDTKLVFALSKDNSYKGDSDNTIAIATVPDLYTNGWRHVAAVWDARSTAAKIYVDGMLLATATNPLYPCNRLHTPEDRLLPLQIGSCNALYDDTLRHRAFLGQLDEIRLWHRALSGQELACQRIISLNGNEPGLELYYRCNEARSAQLLCDATGNNHTGFLRSGAFCDTSLRVIPVTYKASPAVVTAKLICTEDTTFTITLTDSSACGDRVTLGTYGADAKLFKLSTNTLTLAQNIPATFTVQMHSDLIGPVSAGIAVANANSCGNPIYIPLKIQRTTELNYSVDKLALDTIYVGCQNTTYSEATLTICNPSGRTVTISNISLDSGHFTWRSSAALPTVLPKGACVTITVRMDLLDSSKTLLDTLRIVSDETCPGSGVIPVSGRVQDVLGLLLASGKGPITTMNFGEICPGFISGTQTFQYRDLASDTLFVDSIIYDPPNFFGAGITLPMKLAPKAAYLPTYARFRPLVPGPLAGTLRVTANYHGCELAKTVTLSGRGYSVDVEFLTPAVNFGPVTIGKSAQQNADLIDSGTDVRNLDAYLRMGDVFTVTGGRTLHLSSHQTLPVQLTFRPRQTQMYYDTLCVFDEGCYETKCIPVSGMGTFQAFSFNPSYLDISNVIGCGSETGSIAMTNISGQSLAITNCQLIDPTGKFQLVNPMPAGTMANNSIYVFNIVYTPNDLANDRADEVYISVTLSDGQVYNIIVRATSVAPKLYVTPLTTYGIVEAGWHKQQSILIENASTVPQKITSVAVPYGYALLSTNPALPTVLGPRDSLWLQVDFDPTGDSDYNANFTVQVDSPCTMSLTGMLTGHGQSVKLQVPVSFMNYGLVRPCDCIAREVPLPNYSNFVPISIDSVWVDGFGVTNLVPSTFHWQWKSTGDRSLPKTIGAQSADTLIVTFCPDIPATKANLIKNDTLHISAHSQGWTTEFRTMLSGRREMNFQPNVSQVQFPATRVDTSAQPQAVTITVPDITLNPDGDYIQIDSVTFDPDQQVFSARDSMGNLPPWTIKRTQKFKIRLGFFPRAPKLYVARMRLWTSHPCGGFDSTVLVMGSGFAPAYGLQLAMFDTLGIGKDTVHLSICDTLVLPILTSRDVPLEPMDLFYHLGYDTTELQVLGASSTYTNSISARDTINGAGVAITKAGGVSAGVINTVRLKVIGGPKVFPITLDSIDFESDSIVFFKIVAGIDRRWIEIDEPTIALTKVTDFDTVNVKQCGDETVTVHNTGFMPVRLDSLTGLPPWHSVVPPSAPFGSTIAPGDSVTLTIRFCPRADSAWDTTITANTSVNWPGHAACYTIDTGHLQSYGYAPPFPFKLELKPTVMSIDSIGGRIADTIELPILIDRSVPLTPLDMRFALTYDARSLEYLGMSSAYATARVTDQTGALDILLPESQDVAQGEIARAKFLITVPDSILSTMLLTPGRFTSDSIMFIKPIPIGDTTTVAIAGRCSISRLIFHEGLNAMTVPTPNPTTGRVSLDVSLLEDSQPTLRVLSSVGQSVLTLLDGNKTIQHGSYHIEFGTESLASGMYVIELQGGDYHATQRMVVVR